MKSVLLSLCLTLFTISGLAHADDQNPMPADSGSISDPKIIGSWKSATPIYKDKNMVVFLGMAFADSSATMSAICSFPNRKVLEAAVVVPVQVADGKIEVLGTAEAQVKEGGLQCAVQIEPGVVTYTYVGPKLRGVSKGQTMDFVRR